MELNHCAYCYKSDLESNGVKSVKPTSYQIFQLTDENNKKFLIEKNTNQSTYPWFCGQFHLNMFNYEKYGTHIDTQVYNNNLNQRFDHATTSTSV